MGRTASPSPPAKCRVSSRSPWPKRPRPDPACTARSRLWPRCRVFRATGQSDLTAPNDGKKRQLKARHVADGCTASAYTVIVTVLPWTILPLPPITDSDATTIRVALSKTYYDAGAAIWWLWWRFFYTDAEGVEHELVAANNNTIWDPLSTDFFEQIYDIHDGVGTAATGILSPTAGFSLRPYDPANLGWPTTWNSTPTQDWTFQLILRPISINTIADAQFTFDATVPNANSGTEASSKSGAVTNINTQIRDTAHDAQFATNASSDVLHIENFVQAVTGSFTYQLGTGDDTDIVEALFDAGQIGLRPVHLGNTVLNISRQLKCKTPGLIQAPIGGGGTGEPALNWIGGDLAAGEFILEVCGATPGTDPARIQQLSVAINGNGKRVGGLYLNFVTFSDPTKIRVVNCKGGGVKVRNMHDDLVGDVSIENCGWSSLGNKDITGVDDGLNLEEYAWDRDGAGGDTSNESHTLRLQVEQSRFLAIRDVGQLANVTDNIHSERVHFASPGSALSTPTVSGTPGVPSYNAACFTRWPWFFTGTRCQYNQGRFHANSNQNYSPSSEKLVQWDDHGAIVTGAVSIEGDVTLDHLSDQMVGFAWRSITLLPLPSAGVKNWSFVVKKAPSGASSFSAVQVVDMTSSTVLFEVGLDMSGTVPASVAITAGTGAAVSGVEQLLPLSANKFRISGTFTLANAAHTHEYRAFPAGAGGAATGNILIGGFYIGDAPTPETYAKSGVVSLPADQHAILFLAGESMTYNNFNAEGAVTTQVFGAAGATLELNNPNLSGRFRSDFGGGGGPVKVTDGKCALVRTGIDPAIEDALTFTGTQVSVATIGDCGNPGLGRRFKFIGGRVGLLTSDSSLSAIEAFGAVFDNIRDGLQYQTILHNCTVLASTGGASSGTWKVRGYVEIDGGLVVPPMDFGTGPTVNAYGAAHFVGQLTQATVTSILAPGLRLSGGISGLGIPTGTPATEAQWSSVWKRGQIHWNYAWTGLSDPLFWEYTGAAWQPVTVGTLANALTAGTHLTFGGGTYDGSAPKTISTDATSSNTASAIMARDANGDYAARDAVLRATDLSGILTRRSPWCGNATLVAGTVTVSVSGLTNSMQVRFWRINGGTTANFGHLRERNDLRVTGGSGSFQIDSTNGADDGNISWEVIEKL
jgi:hypothetical protein